MTSASVSPCKGTFMPPSTAEDFEVLVDLSRFLDHHQEPGLLVGPDGQQTPLPLEVYATVVKIVEAMKNHRAVTVAPVDQKLSTQEAADHLGISRPTLIKLLEKGAIPFETVEGSRHRRIMLGDLLAYSTRRAREREAALQELVDDAEASELYDIPPEDLRDAVRAARKTRVEGNTTE